MRRSSGVLLHITSLPSEYGIGDLGSGAFHFVDFLTQGNQTFWQVLPFNPTNPGAGNSPYFSLSAFAGNKLLISPEVMYQQGLLSKTDLNNAPEFPSARIDYGAVETYKENLFRKAYHAFLKDKRRYDYEKFCHENADWLEDFVSFVAFKEHFHGQVWSVWPAEIRDRQPEALNKLKNELAERMELERFLQFIFFQQWQRLREHCREHKLQIIGDIPYYVSYDSADVWTHPELFKLNHEKQSTFVAGVPPDYFSATGQLWGNPVYNWDVMQQSGYHWWIQRMKRLLNYFDMVRIDHFRGFVAYWEVAAGESTAINGKWVEAPAIDFFNTLLKTFPNLPIIAEDLGLITADVREVIQIFGFPGMRVLQFAFDDTLPKNPYAPHNHEKNSVIYTGTHDNNTTRGWFEHEISEETKKRIFAYLGREVPADAINWEFIRLAMMSVGKLVLIPMQDILGLGQDARMNFPATGEGNWQWRLQPGQIGPESGQKLGDLTKLYGRD